MAVLLLKVGKAVLYHTVDTRSLKVAVQMVLEEGKWIYIHWFEWL